MSSMEPVATVDTQRFMGRWFVIAHIPPFLTKDAYNAVERYELNKDGQVDVLFTWNEGSFDGPLKRMTPKGFPDHDDRDGVWGMRLIWPFKSDYRIVHLDSDYHETIIGRRKRDYVWIMARDPALPEARLARLMDKVEALGYERGDLRQVPQQSLEERRENDMA